MRAAEQTSLEGQLTTRAAKSVAEGVGAHLGVQPAEVAILINLERYAPEKRLELVRQALGEAGHMTAALVVQWQRHDPATEEARREVQHWLGGTPVAPGLWDKDAEPFVQLLEQTSSHSHRLLLDHGTLRSWQMVRIIDALAAVLAEPLPTTALARTAVETNATVLGRFGPPVYRTLVAATQPLSQLRALNPFVSDADEKIMAAAPAVVAALQSMYLMGYVQQRDLDALRSERARLEQVLEQTSSTT